MAADPRSDKAIPAVSDLELLLSSQNSLIRKLRDECGGLGLQLEEATHSRRSATPFQPPQSLNQLLPVQLLNPTRL